MSDYTITIGFMMVIICFMWLVKTLNDNFQEEKVLWHEERQRLLDRIQAPSFDHLKAAEVRVIKAQKEEKPIERVELL